MNTHAYSCTNKEQLSEVELFIIGVFILLQSFGTNCCSKLLLQSYQTVNSQCFSEILMRRNNTVEERLLFSTVYACMLSYSMYSHHLCIHTRPTIAHGLYGKHEHVALTHMSLNKQKQKQ